MKICQVLEEIFVECVQASEIVDVLFGEGQPLDVVNDLVQACADGVASIIRKSVSNVSFMVLMSSVLFFQPLDSCAYSYLKAPMSLTCLSLMGQRLAQSRCDYIIPGGI